MTDEYLKRLDAALDEVLHLFHEGAWDDIIDQDLSQIGIGRDIIRLARKHGVKPKDLNQESLEFLDGFLRGT